MMTMTTLLVTCGALGVTALLVRWTPLVRWGGLFEARARRGGASGPLELLASVLLVGVSVGTVRAWRRLKAVRV